MAAPAPITSIEVPFKTVEPAVSSETTVENQEPQKLTETTVQNSEPVIVAQPAPVQDKSAPIIKDVSSSYNNSTKKISLTYSFDEEAYITMFMRDSKGKIIQYLEKDVRKTLGKYATTWDVTSVPNGEYSFGIIAKDMNNNVSSAANKFTLNKPVPVPKDVTAPIITNTSVVYNNANKKVTISYSINESSSVEVVVKNSKGVVVKSLENSTKKSAGKYTLTWDVTPFANGSYTISIKASDLSKNTSAKTMNFNLKKVLIGKINASNVLIRQKATTSSKSLGKLQKNYTVTVLSKTGSWYYIQYGSTKGYVYSKYVSNVK
jgi:stage II sporulation protein D